MRPLTTGPQEAMARQAWSRTVELDRTVLEHARALLLALAVLVERAAGLPTVKRLWFLEVMGRGEAEARRLLLVMASGAGAPVEVGAGTAAAPLPLSDFCPVSAAAAAGDAFRLAARFRMLALAVDAMLALAGPRPPFRHAFSSIRHANREPYLVSQFTPSPALRATSPPQSGERSRGVGDDAFPANGAPAHRSLLVLLRRGAVGCPSLFSQGLPLGPVALARPCR